MTTIDESSIYKKAIISKLKESYTNKCLLVEDRKGNLSLLLPIGNLDQKYARKNISKRGVEK